MVENLASKYRMSLSLSCNASLGYHIQAVPPRNPTPQDFEPPTEFIEVVIFWLHYLANKTLDRDIHIKVYAIP